METAKEHLVLTVLLYVKHGEEETFQKYESLVLPLLKNHNGELLLRVRPSEESFIYPDINTPYEMHIIRFASRADYNSYIEDENRKIHSELRNRSIVKTEIIEGFAK